MRIAFMGTPEFAVPTLDALLAAGHEVVAVYSQPPRPAGRGKALRPSPVQARAQSIGIAVRTPLTLRDAAEQEAFAALGLDVAVVAAYGLILPQPVLDAPKQGCLNVHGSLLPRWRGAAPIQRAILAGDVRTGISIMRMERGLDTGPIFTMRATKTVANDGRTFPPELRSTHSSRVPGKSAAELSIELAHLGASLMNEVLANLAAMTPVPQQSTDATYAAKIEKPEAKIDFTQSAEFIERQVRAFNPSPGAFFELNGERIRVLAARSMRGFGSPGVVVGERLTIGCGQGLLQVYTLQRAGRAVMDARQFLIGHPVPIGTILA